MGGWGQSGGNVDAGLQHSTRYDNWAPIFNINGAVEGLTDRFQGKQNVNMKFNVPSSGNISLTVSGLDYNTGSSITKTYVRAASGFVLIGSNIMKRNTTIAQKLEDLGSSSYIHNVHWYNGLIGNSSASNHTWAGADTEMVEVFGLQSRLNDDPNTLPLGYKQRLALACAIMHEPDILFLDEPTSGVDPVTRREFWTHINGVVEKGVTVMVTTHFMDEAEYCDRIGLVFRGRLIASGTTDDLKAKAATAAIPIPPWKTPSSS